DYAAIHDGEAGAWLDDGTMVHVHDDFASVPLGDCSVLLIDGGFPILGEEAQIVEHRANNLVLGTEVKLGQSIALGTENVPHTFTVILRGSASSAADDAQIDAEFDTRMRRIKAVIEAEKPAHTGYTVRFEADPDARHMEG
ncbi:MAG: hypothetical protein ACK2UX_15115, partial [Anaerolineae bacterium]